MATVERLATTHRWMAERPRSLATAQRLLEHAAQLEDRAAFERAEVLRLRQMFSAGVDGVARREPRSIAGAGHSIERGLPYCSPWARLLPEEVASKLIPATNPPVREERARLRCEARERAKEPATCLEPLPEASGRPA